VKSDMIFAMPGQGQHELIGSWRGLDEGMFAGTVSRVAVVRFPVPATEVSSFPVGGVGGMSSTRFTIFGFAVGLGARYTSSCHMSFPATAIRTGNGCVLFQ